MTPYEDEWVREHVLRDDPAACRAFANLAGVRCDRRTGTAPGNAPMAGRLVKGNPLECDRPPAGVKPVCAGVDLLDGWRNWPLTVRRFRLEQARRCADGIPTIRYDRSLTKLWGFQCPVPTCLSWKDGFVSAGLCQQAWMHHCATDERHPADFTPGWPADVETPPEPAGEPLMRDGLTVYLFKARGHWAWRCEDGDHPFPHAVVGWANRWDVESAATRHIYSHTRSPARRAQRAAEIAAHPVWAMLAAGEADAEPEPVPAWVEQPVVWLYEQTALKLALLHYWVLPEFVNDFEAAREKYATAGHGTCGPGKLNMRIDYEPEGISYHVPGEGFWMIPWERVAEHVPVLWERTGGKWPGHFPRVEFSPTVPAEWPPPAEPEPVAPAAPVSPDIASHPVWAMLAAASARPAAEPLPTPETYQGERVVAERVRQRALAILDSCTADTPRERVLWAMGALWSTAKDFLGLAALDYPVIADRMRSWGPGVSLMPSHRVYQRGVGDEEGLAVLYDLKRKVLWSASWLEVAQMLRPQDMSPELSEALARARADMDARQEEYTKFGMPGPEPTRLAYSGRWYKSMSLCAELVARAWESREADLLVAC